MQHSRNVMETTVVFCTVHTPNMLQQQKQIRALCGLGVKRLH